MTRVCLFLSTLALLALVSSTHLAAGSHLDDVEPTQSPTADVAGDGGDALPSDVPAFVPAEGLQEYWDARTLNADDFEFSGADDDGSARITAWRGKVRGWTFVQDSADDACLPSYVADDEAYGVGGGMMTFDGGCQWLGAADYDDPTCIGPNFTACRLGVAPGDDVREARSTKWAGVADYHVFMVAARPEVTEQTYQRMLSSWDAQNTDDYHNPSFMIDGPRNRVAGSPNLGKPFPFFTRVFEERFSSSVLNNLKLGAKWNLRTFAKFRIGELMIWNRTLAEHERRAVVDALNQRWVTGPTAEAPDEPIEIDATDGLVWRVDASLEGDDSIVFNELAEDRRVAEWHDQTRFGRHAVASSLAAQPLYKLNAFGAKPGIFFDGVDNWLGVHDAIRAQRGQFHCFMVVRRDANDELARDKWARLLSVWDGDTNDDWMQPSWLMHGRFRADGTELPFDTIVLVRRGFNYAIGEVQIAAQHNLNKKSTVTVGEVLIFDRVLSTIEEVIIIRRLKAKWETENALLVV